jgi:Mn2+/Fe2+ NRAMP family transporter
MSDPNQLQQLEEAERAGGWTAWRTYLKFSGPGWLQSAITLGGGSLAGALFLGVVGGYSMLWVQATAVILGVIMLAAISYVSLSIEETPFQGMRTHINPVLAWGWILATMAANMVWSLPQFSLAYAALTENITRGSIENADSLSWKLGISLFLLALVVWVTLFYGKKGVGIKIYEGILKVVVGVIVLSFAGVVVKLALSDNGLPLGEILGGFIPDPAPHCATAQAPKQMKEIAILVVGAIFPSHGSQADRPSGPPRRMAHRAGPDRLS